MNPSYPTNGAASTPAHTYTFSQKWGDDPFTALGHTQVPSALIEYAARLGLMPEECWLIVCLLKFKHTPADPYPSQGRLAALVGQSEDTVRRLLKRIERRGLLHVERVRGDLGHYTHSVYDLRPLRAALNEAYYQDHPQERPEVPAPAATVQICTVAPAAPAATVQICTVAPPPRKIGRSHPAKSAPTTVQNCGPKKSLKKRSKEDLLTLNVPGPRRNAPLRTPERLRLAHQAVALTGDEKSRRRYEQLAGIADQAGAWTLWDTAYRATEARLRKSREPLDAPGAYFCATLTRLLCDAGVYVPVGTPVERQDIRAQIAASFQQAAANGVKSDRVGEAGAT
jgi:hypothetical protein